MKKIMKFLLPVLAIVAGAAGGHVLKGNPAPDPHAEESAHNGGHDSAGHSAPASASASQDHGGHSVDASHGSHESHDGSEDGSADAWFSFSNQFFVPLLRHASENDLMILSLTLQSTVNDVSEVTAKESLLRDIVLRRLLIIANSGGFDGNFTTEARYTKLRRELLEAVQSLVGDKVRDVLIEDIARQTG